MMYGHAERDLDAIRCPCLQTVELLRCEDRPNTHVTRWLHQVTGRSTRDPANFGPKWTRAARETSAA
jgi:hypothetical protein